MSTWHNLNGNLGGTGLTNLPKIIYIIIRSRLAMLSGDLHVKQFIFQIVMLAFPSSLFGDGMLC